MYNDWFIHFAPQAFKDSRAMATDEVVRTFETTHDLTAIDMELLRTRPYILPTLRMATCPPLAVDRLAGIAGVSNHLIKVMDKSGKLPTRMSWSDLNRDLAKVAELLRKMVDSDILVWLDEDRRPSSEERYRAATIIADRRCGAVANPIIRNAQEIRQLEAMENWLKDKGYSRLPSPDQQSYKNMAPATFGFRLNVPGEQGPGGRQVKLSVDAVVMPKTAPPESLPLLVEAKSAGDFTNVNKRRKEEATKMRQLRQSLGQDVQFILLLCGYFDSGYLGYEAAEGIDWVWEHRLDDLVEFGL